LAKLHFFLTSEPTKWIFLRLYFKMSVMICQPFDIQKQNETNLALRNFIQRSAQLLPLFAELKTSGLTDYESIEQYNAISNLISHFKFDDEISHHQMNSDILERIRLSYNAINNSPQLSEKESENILSHFFKEYERLLNVWKKVEMN